MAVEPHLRARLTGNDAEAVMFDLMQPLAAGRQLIGFGWETRRDEAGREGTLQPGNQIRLANHNCNFYQPKARVLLPLVSVMTHSDCVVASPGPPAKTSPRRPGSCSHLSSTVARMPPTAH